jgi:hypothetical protein
MRFYKYRAFSGDLTKDYALDGLIGSYAIFSGRKNFNDLNDSKIHIPSPTASQVQGLLLAHRTTPQTATISSWIKAGRFTPIGIKALEDFETAFNETIDRYPIYCVSESDRDALLWAHYASAHTGFCIEFEFLGGQPKQVTYQDRLASIPLLDFIKEFYRLGGIDMNLAIKIHNALHVKESRWSYEVEHRWLAANGIGKLSKGQKFMKVPYDPSWVKAVIFGCRTSDELKSYIRANLPFPTQFKQAIETIDSIEVVLC